MSPKVHRCSFSIVSTLSFACRRRTSAPEELAAEAKAREEEAKLRELEEKQMTFFFAFS